MPCCKPQLWKADGHLRSVTLPSYKIYEKTSIGVAIDLFGFTMLKRLLMSGFRAAKI